MKYIAFVDVETTGINPNTAEVIELGIVLGEYQENGIMRFVDEYCELRQPSTPIPPMITRLTGINDTMVKGKVLDREKILAIFRKADAVIAHNASFDRGFIIRLFPDTIENDWYCSVRQIKWKSYGFENGKLQQLLQAHNIRVEKAHRALDDAKNLATLLCCDIPVHPAKDTYIDFLMSKNPMRKPN
jgi:DNA polymerase III subunit epsilon